MGHGLKYITFYVQKHITPSPICHNLPLVRDKPQVARTFVRLFYCQPHRMGHGQHLNLEMDMDSWYGRVLRQSIQICKSSPEISKQASMIAELTFDLNFVFDSKVVPKALWPTIRAVGFPNWRRALIDSIQEHDVLTHLPLDKMAAISQTIFAGAFSRMKSFVFWLKFHWSLFLRVQFTITQHWFRYWLSAE